MFNFQGKIKTLFILGISFISISCSSTHIENNLNTNTSSKTNERIIYYHNREEDILLIANLLYDEKTDSFYKPRNKEEEAAAIPVELVIREVPSYYAYFPELNKAIIYQEDETNKSNNLSLKESNRISVKPLDYELTYSNDEQNTKESSILVNLDKKFRPKKPNSTGIIGTWVSIESSTPEEITFLDNGEIQLYSDKYFDYHSMYEIYNNLISVQIIKISKLSGRQSRSMNIYYYDEKLLYEVIFPLEDLSEDTNVIKAIDTAKYSK